MSFVQVLNLEASWNVMAHTQKPDLVFRRNGRVHLNRPGRGGQFSRLLAAEVCASAVVILPGTKVLILSPVLNCFYFQTLKYSKRRLWTEYRHSWRLLYRVSQEEWTKLRESVPYVELYRYNPKHLYPKLNGYGDNGHRKVWASGVSTYCTPSVRMPGNETPLANVAMQWPWRDYASAAACVKCW